LATTTDIVEIWTDGACIGNPGPGGWAYIKRLGDRRARGSGFVAAITTNIEMEMVAVIQALRSLKRADTPAVVHTDCQMIVQGMNEWLPSWIARGWKKADGTAVANRELWESLKALVDARTPEAAVRFVWVKGHAGNPENEEAHSAAERAARRAAKSAVEMPTGFDADAGLMVPLFREEDV
jgi:ribonuclease HI